MFTAIVDPATNLLLLGVADLLHGSLIGSQSVGRDRLNLISGKRLYSLAEI
jgi:hypothetical protein